MSRKELIRMILFVTAVIVFAVLWGFAEKRNLENGGDYVNPNEITRQLQGH